MIVKTGSSWPSGEKFKQSKDYLARCCPRDERKSFASVHIMSFRSYSQANLAKSLKGGYAKILFWPRFSQPEQAECLKKLLSLFADGSPRLVNNNRRRRVKKYPLSIGGQTRASDRSHPRIG